MILHRRRSGSFSEFGGNDNIKRKRGIVKIQCPGYSYDNDLSDLNCHSIVVSGGTFKLAPS